MPFCPYLCVRDSKESFLNPKDLKMSTKYERGVFHETQYKLKGETYYLNLVNIII